MREPREPVWGPGRPRQPDARAIDGFREELVDWSGFQLDINYGFSKVRFPAPSPWGRS